MSSNPVDLSNLKPKGKGSSKKNSKDMGLGAAARSES